MFCIPSHILRRLSTTGLLTMSLSALAQTPTPPPAPASEPAFVTQKEFRNKMFVVKHRDPRDLTRSLRSLGSGFKGAEVIANEGSGTISVRDFPENIAAIEEALKRLDVPAPLRREVEFHVHVLFASNAGGPEGSYPEELREVLAALKSTLAYRSYTQAASLIERAQEGSRGIGGSGATEVQTTEAKGETHAVSLPFTFRIDTFKVENPDSGPAVIKLEGLSFEFYSVAAAWQAKIQTNLSLKDGEKVVVGTSTLRDRGVVVVVTAHLLK